MKKTKLLFALSVGVLAATSFAAHGWNLQKEENGSSGSITTADAAPSCTN
jgi:hypothetical protein